MNFITAHHTDVGVRKKTNQDSLLIEQANTEKGPVLLVAVCDGMGGHEKGELASSTMIKSLSDWFYHTLPVLLYKGLDSNDLKESWDDLVYETNHKVADYGEDLGIVIGTTCVALLAFENVYYILNVGDSRAYILTDNIYQLTKDQTFCQREMDLGRMTPEQAATDPRRSVLLQCIGSGDVVEPDYFIGALTSPQCFLLCSDGFSHYIHPNDIYDLLSPENAVSTEYMQHNLKTITDLVMSRGEKDNITSVLVKVQ